MTAYHSKRGPVEGCPQPDESIRERAWTDGQKSGMHREAFERWVSSHTWFKATLVLCRRDSEDSDYPDPCINSRWQGWQAAIRYRDEQTGEFAEMRRKARCWDDLERAKVEASRVPDNSSWKEVARRQGLIAGVRACRVAHGFSLMESRDCVETYLRDEQEKGE